MPRSLPAATTRSERFDDLVLDAFERLLPRWGRELRAVEVVVQEVPPGDGLAPDPVPLARTVAATARTPVRIVVHRRPVELRAASVADRRDLLEELMAEQVADLLGLTPELVDPSYLDPDDEA